MLQRALALDHQGIDHRILEGAGDIGARLRVVRILTNGIGGKGLQAGKAKVEPGTIGHRTREGKTSRHALLRHFRQHRAAGIVEPQQLGGFVEGFAGGVVDRLAQQRILADAGYANQLGMAARHQQRHKRELRWVFLQHRRQQMPFHMVYRNRRHLPREGERAADSGADQQRADQARSRRIGDSVDLLRLQVRLFQRCLNQRHGFAHVIARRQFRHYAAVIGVQFHLAVKLIGEQARFVIIDCDAGFIAGCFNTQNSHSAYPLLAARSVA